MSLRFRHLAPPTAALAILLSPGAAYACGMCFHADLAAAIPGSIQAMFIGMVWFLLLSVYSRSAGVAIRGIPHNPTIALFLIVLTALIWPIFTPFPAAIFLMFAGSTLIRGALAAVSDDRLPGACRARNRIAAVSLSAIALFAALETIPRLSMDDVDLMLRFKGTGTASAALARLEAKGSAAIPSFRRVVRSAGPWYVQSAAAALLKHGNPDEEVPFLIGVMYPKSGNSGWRGADVELALREWGKFWLSRTDPEEEWHAAWAEKKTAEAAAVGKPGVARAAEIP